MDCQNLLHIPRLEARRKATRLCFNRYLWSVVVHPAHNVHSWTVFSCLKSQYHHICSPYDCSGIQLFRCVTQISFHSDIHQHNKTKQIH